MTIATVTTIPNIEVQLTVEQLITAVRQLEPGERAKIARALADAELDAELTQLIMELYGQPSALVEELINGEQDETEYLLSSDKMKERLLAARESSKGIPIETVYEKLGI